MTTTKDSITPFYETIEYLMKTLGHKDYYEFVLPLLSALARVNKNQKVMAWENYIRVLKLKHLNITELSNGTYKISRKGTRLSFTYNPKTGVAEYKGLITIPRHWIQTIEYVARIQKAYKRNTTKG